MLVTTCTNSRDPVFADSACARIAVETLYSIQDFYPFYLYGFVIMPDHCHFLLRMPEGGSVSKMMNVYKRAVTFNLGIKYIWQARFHIRMPHDPIAALQYVHRNPVKKNLCMTPEDYPWSSASGKWDVAELGCL